jgi:hypothetical protein
MTHPFDPYHQWLGIRDPQRPPNLYRLLGIDLFEGDPDVIETAADRQMAHLRTFQNGPHATLSQQLLNEVSAAKVRLLDEAKKARYDQQLRRHQPPGEPPVASSDLFDKDDLEVVVQGSSVALRPPGRSPRAERPWYVSMMVLLPVLGIVLCLVAYRVYRDYFTSPGPVIESNLADASSSKSTTSRGQASSSPDEGTSPMDDPSAGETSSPVDDPEADTPPSDPESADAEDAPPGEAADAPPTHPPGEAASSPRVRVPAPAADGNERSDSTDAEAWNPAALEITGEPARFTTNQPMGPFLMALAQRDFAAAESALQALRVHRALGLPETLFHQAELIRETIAQFWQSVDASLETLATGDELTLGQVEMVVVRRDGESVTLESPSGQQQVLELERAKLQGDLAIALVRRRHASSPPIAWRLIATFLAIDHQGDVIRAEHWAQQADLQGVATTFLTEILRSLSGDNDPIMPESTSDSVASPLTAPVANSDIESASDDHAIALPDTTDQQQARREVLAPTLAELRQQQVPAEKWAGQLLQRAESNELDSAARYVLLDSALKRARTQRDMDTAMAVIDVLARDFEQSRTDLRYDLLQSLARRLKGEERRRHAELAQEFARTAVAGDQFDEALRFASLAQSIGRSVPDRFFRRYLLDFRLEVDAIQKAHQSLESSDADSAGRDPSTRAQHARFRVLSQGDFQTDLSDLRATDDAALRSIVEQELARPKTVEQQQSLARGWLQLSDQLSAVEKVNALRRARYWYTACLADLSRVQRVEAQQDLDAIDRVLGRESDRLDLTSIPPIGVSVGYGTFGINQNIDAASNSQVQPIPQVEGNRLTRFLWACARSRIEYLVPEGARQFRAIGIVNAATQDGVRFVVKVDRQIVFVSPLLKVMGEQLPIQVDLPDGAETLELIVEPQKSNVFDHTYWVNPQLVF